jgi:hypothetical protein
MQPADREEVRYENRRNFAAALGFHLRLWVDDRHALSGEWVIVSLKRFHYGRSLTLYRLL